MPIIRRILLLVIATLLCQSALAQEASFDLGSLSLEELMDLEVSLISRTETKLFETAAAAFVLTGDEIRRAGVTTLPDALRLVPGMQVASVDANKWAISARGFAHRFANKLLVIVDGRHVYTPLFAGVFWEVLDVALEDVERIEVVRGPGATLWGANAVNGIVSIVTKNAGKTQGAAASLTQGSASGDLIGVARYGGQIKGGGRYRAYGKFFGRDGFFDPAGQRVDDEWTIAGGGFRADWDKVQDRFSLQGNLSSSEIEQNLAPERSSPAELLDESQDALHTNSHILAHWQHALSPRSNFALKGYYDLYERDDGLNDVRSQAYEIDFQHYIAPRVHRQFIWGLSYRYTRDQTRTSFDVPFDLPDDKADLFSAFVHGEATLADGRLRLALGTKLEHNEYTDIEYQPSARAIWLPDGQHAVWVAATRAVRTPALSDFRRVPDFGERPDFGGPPDFGERPDFGPPDNPFTNGEPDFKSETLQALEVGYRLHSARGLFFDITAYYNDYSYLKLIPFISPPILPPSEGGGPPSRPSGPPPSLDAIKPVDASTLGGELVAEWHGQHSRLRATYALVAFDMPSNAPRPAGTGSEQRVMLWSSLDVRDGVQADAILRYVDPIDEPKIPEEASEFVSSLPGYTDLDLRLSWRPRTRWELSLVGQNLLNKQRPEYMGFALDSATSETRRAVYAVVRWGF